MRYQDLEHANELAARYAKILLVLETLGQKPSVTKYPIKVRNPDPSAAANKRWLEIEVESDVLTQAIEMKAGALRQQLQNLGVTFADMDVNERIEKWINR